MDEGGVRAVVFDLESALFSTNSLVIRVSAGPQGSAQEREQALRHKLKPPSASEMRTLLSFLRQHEAAVIAWSPDEQELCGLALSALGLEDDFDRVCGLRSWDQPLVESLKMACAEAGAIPQHCVFVGDSREAAAACVALGMGRVGVGVAEDKGFGTVVHRFDDLQDALAPFVVRPAKKSEGEKSNPAPQPSDPQQSGQAVSLGSGIQGFDKKSLRSVQTIVRTLPVVDHETNKKLKAAIDALANNSLVRVLPSNVLGRVVSHAMVPSPIPSDLPEAYYHLAACVDVFVEETRELMELVPVGQVELVEPPALGLLGLRRAIVATRIAESLANAFRSYGPRPCIAVERVPKGLDFEWRTFSDVHHHVTAVSHALASHLPQGAFVGIAGENSYASVAALVGCLVSQVVAVPLAVHLSVEALHNIARESKLQLVMCSRLLLPTYLEVRRRVVEEEGEQRAMSLVVLDPLTPPLESNQRSASEAHQKGGGGEGPGNEEHEAREPVGEGNARALEPVPWLEWIGRSRNATPLAQQAPKRRSVVLPFLGGAARYEGTITSTVRGRMMWLRVVHKQSETELVAQLVLGLGDVQYARVTVHDEEAGEQEGDGNSPPPQQQPRRTCVRVVGESGSPELTGFVLRDGDIAGKVQGVEGFAGAAFKLSPIPIERGMISRVASGGKCGNGHMLTKLDDPARFAEEKCARCKERLGIQAQVFGCEEAGCEHSNLCGGCQDKALECPADHGLLPCGPPNDPSVRFTLGCGVCERPIAPSEGWRTCFFCGFDLCNACRDAMLTLSVRRSYAAQLNRANGADTLRMVLYTSGSTGVPKGAMVSDAMLCWEAADVVNVDENTKEMSFVGVIDSPLSVSSTSHTLLGYIANGSRLAVFEHLSQAFEVVERIGPTALSFVPQKWAALYQRYQLESAGLSPKEREALDDRYRHMAGRRVRTLNCGGALPNPTVMAWLKRLFDWASVTENYATTETGAITNSNVNGDGIISAQVSVKLVDWGEYKSTDKPYPRGEICVRTNSMVMGYFNRPELTAKAFDEDGFFRTGDIGERISVTRIRIIDRKSNLFKLSNGEWVSPENVETALVAHEAICQALVHGSSDAEAVVAILHPGREMGPDQALQACREACERAHLRHFEVPRAVHLVDEAFSEENGLLTHSGKLSRTEFRRRFQHELQALLVQCGQQVHAQLSDKRARAVEILQQALKPNADVGALQESWERLQWDSIHAVSAVGAINSVLHIDLPVALLLTQPPNLAQVVTHACRVGPRSRIAPADNSLSLPAQSDWVLADEVRPKAPRGVFLTGATGFLGCAILRELLARGEDDGGPLTILCLVRALDPQAARTRLQEKLETAGYWTPAIASQFEARVRAVVGDLARPVLGMTHEAAALVKTTCGTVVHCGAAVHHLHSYEALRRTNTLSVVELLRLLADAPHVGVHFVSTGSVVGASPSSPSTSGYTMSKLVAEKLLGQARERGFAVSVSRPPLIAPDTRTGFANHTDWLARFVRGAAELGAVRAARGNGANENREVLVAAPVDHVAAVLVQAVLAWSEPGQRMRNPCPEPLHFPLTRVRVSDFVAGLVAAFGALRPPVAVAPVGAQEWADRLQGMDEHNPMWPLRHQFVEGLEGDDPGADGRAMEGVAALEDAEGARRVALMVKWLQEHGHVRSQAGGEF